MKQPKYYCPVDDLECPYYDSYTGQCKMTEASPVAECDAFCLTEDPEDFRVEE